MKKLLAALLVVCLVFAGAIGYINHRNDQVAVTEETPAQEETTAPEATAQPEPITVRTVDYDALYASHQPEEIIMSIDGKDVSWGEYFYMLYTQTTQIEDYFQTMASYYGIAVDWEEPMDGTDRTYAEYALENADSMLLQLAAIEGFAAENGVELTEENLESIQQQRESDILAVGGEGATEADFEEYLAGSYMTLEMYDDINSLNILYQQNFIQIYGENGELLSEDAAMQYLEDNQYLSANHILLMTIDSSTGEALDESATAEKQALAAELAEELRAIEDPEALVARFKELKEEYCEDTGKTSYPDGYTFTPGTMVTEFEDACNSLEAYQVSEPVQSSYGYHIILRLPLDVDSLIQYSSAGTAMNARSLAANAEYGSRLQSYLDGLSISYAEGFEPVDLLSYLR